MSGSAIESAWHEVRFWATLVWIAVAWLALCLLLKALGRRLGDPV